MSGALSRILARSRGAPAAVRPRLASRWEAGPVPREDAAEMTSSHTRVHPAEATSHETIASVGAVPPERAVQRAGPQPPRTSPDPPQEPAVVERRIETRIEHRIAPEPVTERELPAPPPAPPAAPRHVEPVKPGTRVDRTVVHADGSPPAPVPERRTTEVVREREVEKPQRSTDRVHIQPVEIRTVRREPVPSVPQRAQLKPQAAEPPVIRVTIGRVDVRAVPEPQVPRRSEKREPSRRLELDEYLKHRRGER